MAASQRPTDAHHQRRPPLDEIGRYGKVERGNPEANSSSALPGYAAPQTRFAVIFKFHLQR